MNQDIDVTKIKEMLDQYTLKKNPQLDRNKAIFDLLAEKVEEAYNQGFEDGLNEGLSSKGPSFSPPSQQSQYPFYKVTWIRPGMISSSPLAGDIEYGCNCCNGNCNHRE